ncbi:cardiotrophin-1 isoform X1 [Podarcis raffonei]|uniref:cardiotrophin-1 isoform X1 n=1 Tax=Podarcis raffonei TaxID=65483 RepID=UPI00232963A7|nr:cardiotrophin-1 isoform X1 [Podarcis raffonei]
MRQSCTEYSFGSFSARSLLVICAGLVHIVSPDRDSSISTIIGQTFNLARLMKANSTVLLNTYLSHQGSPFSDSGFDARRLRYEGVPTAAIPFLEWRTLSHVKRVEKNYEAYTAFAEFLQLVRDDQFELNPTKVELLDMLKVTRLRIQGLLSNLTAIMSALGAPPAAVTDPLMLESVEADTFEKKVRGYVVCHTYKEWIDRTVKDFSLLAEKFPA